jgi:hypothetical protein
LGFTESGAPVFSWECITLAVDDDAWNAIDTFWMCHPASGGELQRASLPHEGTVLQQSNWIMWAFSIIQDEYNSVIRGQHGESQRQQKSQQALAEMKKHGH